MLWRAFAGFIISTSIAVSVCDAQMATVQIRYPEGRKTVYKNSFSVRYLSDSADKLLTGRDAQGGVTIFTRGEWKSTEVGYTEVSDMEGPLKEGEQGVLATLTESDNSLEFAGTRLAARQIPNPFTDLNDRQFAWRFNKKGETLEFHPRFKTYELANRSMITDVYQLWMPDFCPVYPEGEVQKGDKWSGEQILLDSENARVKIRSTYEVKKVSEKKGTVVVEFEEKRDVDYIYIINSGSLAVQVDGSGTGKGEWKIDATNGVVLKHKMVTRIDRPAVSKAGQPEPIPEVRAEVQINFQRELDAIEE
jgi:hypothetical protein